MKTTMFATDMVDPVIGLDIPGKPRTTASTITSTMTPATSRMKEGMTGANAPQVLLEVESVIIFYTWKISLYEWDIAMSKPWMVWRSYSLTWFRFDRLQF